MGEISGNRMLNELAREIDFSIKLEPIWGTHAYVGADDPHSNEPMMVPGVKIRIRGPNSTMTNHVTLLEARWLHTALGHVLDQAARQALSDTGGEG